MKPIYLSMSSDLIHQGQIKHFKKASGYGIL